MSPFALLTTWTCYGTWLPGDVRGHVSNLRLTDGGFLPKQNVPGTPFSEGDANTRQRARQQQSFPTVWLNSDQARCVVVSLIEAARNRNWHIVRAAVMSNHVHVLTAGCPNDGPVVRRILKGVSQAALSQHHGTPKRWWTAGGSDRYKNDDHAIETAIRYIENQSGILAFVREMTIANTSGGA